MITTTFSDVLKQAAEMSNRTRDKIPVSEQTMLQGFLATEFQTLFNAQCWPELIPDFVAVTPANNSFSKQEGTANEMGDILAITTQNPHLTDYWRNINFVEGDNIVFINDSVTSIYVEYMLPYPGTTFLDLAPGVMTYAAFLAATLPRRWRNILAHKAAAHLLGSDGDAAGAGVQLGLAERSLVTEINRLPAVPPWRGIQMGSTRMRRMGQPAVLYV